MSKYKAVAIELAEKAGQIMLHNFKQGIKKEFKDDDTFITIADRQINQLVLDTIGKKFPNHAILSEEGSKHKKSEFVWVCDPIDGTAPFSHALPTSVFLLALTYKGKSILGVIHDPYMKRLVVAEKGEWAYLNGERISVSSNKTLFRTAIDVESWYAFPYDLNPIRHKLIQEKSYAMSIGCVGYGGLLVAIGEFSAAIFSKDTPWDAAALKVIIEEAGGKFTNLFNQEQRYDRKITGFIASNGHIHSQLVKLIAKNIPQTSQSTK